MRFDYPHLPPPRREIQTSLTPNEVKRLMWHYDLDSEVDAHMIAVSLFLSVNTPTPDEPHGKVRAAVVSVLQELGYTTDHRNGIVFDIVKGFQRRFLR